MPSAEGMTNHSADRMPRDLDGVNEADYMMHLRQQRDLSGLSLKEIETTWRKRFPGSKHAIGKSALGELFNKDTLPRKRDQLRELLTVLIEARRGRTSEINLYCEVGAMLLLQRKGHKRNATPRAPAAPAGNGTATANPNSDTSAPTPTAEEHPPPTEVMALAAQHGYGEYTYAHKNDRTLLRFLMWGFALLFGVFGTLFVLDERHAETTFPSGVAFWSLAPLAVWVGIVEVQREPVLYMFSGGVVICRKTRLRSYAWTDLYTHTTERVPIFNEQVVLELRTTENRTVVAKVDEGFFGEVLALAHAGGAHSAP